jgi:AraC family transcriptional regulator
VILTEMPDLSPRPYSLASAAFQKAFYRRWGRENCVVSGVARHAHYRPFCQTLSIKCVAHGAETYFVDDRRVTVRDETWLVLNEGRTYGSLIDGPTESYSFAIFFRPGLANETAAACANGTARALDDGAEARRLPVEFEETLRQHDAALSPLLRYIQARVFGGTSDELWLEEQCQELSARLVLRHAHDMHRTADDPRARRREVDRRMRRALDFMHANLQAPITLGDMAAAACLSAFHFLRFFRASTGRTPGETLRLLRTRRARALLESTSLTRAEIATRVGLSRSALWRCLRSAQATESRASFLAAHGEDQCAVGARE